MLRQSRLVPADSQVRTATSLLGLTWDPCPILSTHAANGPLAPQEAGSKKEEAKGSSRPSGRLWSNLGGAASLATV